MDVQRGFNIGALVLPYGLGNAAGQKLENGHAAVHIVRFLCSDGNQQRCFTCVVDQSDTLQIVLDAFRLGRRTRPQNEHSQTAEHEKRKAKAERDPADCIENIWSAVRKIPRADDAEQKHGEQIEHQYLQTVLVCPDLLEASLKQKQQIPALRFLFQQIAFSVIHLPASTSIR